jgi:hypothetical protein
MGEVFFVLKTMVITIVVVMILQIKIGSSTIEQKSMTWIHESVVVESLRGVADGAVKIFSKGFNSVRSTITGDVSDRLSSETKAASFELKRGEAYYREQWRRKRPRFEHADDSTQATNRRAANDPHSSGEVMSASGAAMDSDAD